MYEVVYSGRVTDALREPVVRNPARSAQLLGRCARWTGGCACTSSSASRCAS